jgi:thermitase
MLPRVLCIAGRPERTIAWLLLATLLAASAFVPMPARAAGPDAGDAVPDELLVGFDDTVAPRQAEGIYQAQGATKLERLRRLNVHRIRIDAAALPAMEQRLRRQPGVVFVERNRRVAPAFTPPAAFTPAFTPNDPSFPSQWHLAAISATRAWDITTGSSAIVIAILDSGVEASHPDLAGRLVPGWNFYDNTANTADVFGHGTPVAGVAAATGNNGLGVVGVAMQSRIMPIRVSDSSGYAYYSTLASGLAWAADNGARVMNMSFAGIAASSAIRTAARYARSHGAVVVAAAGNCGCFDATSETAEIISVSATDPADALASWSSRGNYVDVAAPGAGILTTSRGGGYSSVSGTSFASPITAGVVALMMAANSALTPTQIDQLLKANTDDRGTAGWDPEFGFGRVNAYRAVAAAAGSVVDTQAPAVAIASPTGGSVAGTVAVAVAASDNVGVTRVELWVDGVLALTDAAAPWTFAWDTTTAAGGAHSLVAKAYDASGNARSSAAVSVAVANGGPSQAPADVTPPAVVMTGWTYASASGISTVSVAASDNVGVTRVELWVDGARIATDTAAPWSLVWNSKTKTSGSYLLVARAYDAAGNVGVSAGITIAANPRSSIFRRR